MLVLLVEYSPEFDSRNFHEDEAAITSTLSGILVGCFSGG